MATQTETLSTYLTKLRRVLHDANDVYWTAAAKTATQLQDATIVFQFAGDAKADTDLISCEAGRSASTPQSSRSDDGMSVEWTTSGARCVCHIRQPVPA